MAMKVLVVDDDLITREMLRHALEEEGHQVELAADGREALDALRRGAGHLVITDWEMPNINGIDLCRAIRSEGYNGYVYIIILTSHGQSQHVVEGLQAGADDFITKPFIPAELQMRVRAGERVLSLETREVAIFAMAKLAESRDPETGAHLERVRGYSRILAETMRERPEFAHAVTGEFVRLIYQTSPLHDIGKVAIPDCVLLKAGSLTNREFEIMKSHARCGSDTLEAALRQYPHAAFLRMARDIAASHHERFDGRGYPDGLAGEDIPLSGRIVAVADVYDALSSKRVYKEAFTHDVAKAIILEESGNHFDPDIVDCFVEAEDRFLELPQGFQDQAMVA